MSPEQLRELAEKHAKGVSERAKIPLAAARDIVAAAMKDTMDAMKAGQVTQGVYFESLKRRIEGLKVN